MRSVTRPEKPKSLKLNEAKWKEDLLREIAIAKASGSKVAKKYWNKYKQKDVRAALDVMYGGLCCYCECRIRPAAYVHIEHRRPKKLYPRHTFSWGNLHLACPTCNGAKLNKWDTRNPILDAARDTVSEHLEHNSSYVRALKPRGKTTVEHADLNRGYLCDARGEVLLRILCLADELRSGSDWADPDIARRKLEELKHEAFGGLVSHFIETYLELP